MPGRARHVVSVVVLSLSLLDAVGAAAQTPPEHPHAPSGSSLPLFPTREATGTAWAPDLTPMEGVHGRWRAWELMFHGSAFAQYLYEPGDRHRSGGNATHQGSVVNFGMGMARRPVGKGRLGLRAMISLEPLTVPGCGYLSFLATGEICEGDTIHDRQHPHEVFMEIAADYDRPLRSGLRWQIYAGLAGEPALGPPGFLHRTSAVLNPIAPISHHWLDATHVSFGVITSGVYGPRWKVEGSVFNGREPDHARGDLDLGPLDSFSGRLSWLPAPTLVVQASAARLRAAEASPGNQPRTSVTRVTGSATHTMSRAAGGVLSTTVAYGANAEREVVVLDLLDAVTHAALIETTASDRRGSTIFGRAEIVQKPAHDLHAHEHGVRIFAVGKVQAGYARTIVRWKGTAASLGGFGALSLVPEELASRYGGRVAPGLGLFVNVRPASEAPLQAR